MRATAEEMDRTELNGQALVAGGEFGGCREALIARGRTGRRCQAVQGSGDRESTSSTRVLGRRERAVV